MPTRPTRRFHRRLGLLAGSVCLLALGLTPTAQSLSAQVLQLLTRVNTWTATQTFQDLRVADLTPSVTTSRIYNSGGNLYWDGVLIGDVGAPVSSPHNILSATHPDTAVAAVARGALIVGNATPAWSRLTVGSAGQFLRTDGTDVAWGTDGSALTALNATALASGTVPLARLSGITNAEIAAGAAIAWTKLSLAGSSLADLATRSAADLSSGTLDDARLSANVSLFGASVDSAEIANGTIADADIATGTIGLDKLNGAYAGCSVGETLTIGVGPVVECGSAVGTGTVTSVALSVPAGFTVSGSPVTTSGTLALGLSTQTANTVWAGPSTGSPAAPAFRALVNADLPLSGVGAGTYSSVTVNTAGVVTAGSANQSLSTVTGTLAVGNGGTGLTTATDDVVMIGNGTAWAGLALPNTGTTGALQYTTATNTFSALASVTTASNTQTLTNKTFDAAATGNVLSLIGRQYFPVGSCVGATPTTAAFGNDNGTTTMAAAACTNLTERALAVFNFDATTDEAVVLPFVWPSEWTGSNWSVGIRWLSATGATAGRVVWAVDVMCIADGVALPATFGGTATGNQEPSTTAGASTVLGLVPTLTGLNCNPGGTGLVRLRRLGTDASDTMAGDASLLSVVIRTDLTQ